MKRLSTLIASLLLAMFTAPVLAGPTRDIPLTGKLLNIPIAASTTTGTSNVLRISVNGTVIHVATGIFPSDPANIRFWTFLEVGDYLGSTAKLEITTGTTTNSDAFLALIENADTPRSLKPFYTETGRPQFHFSQKVGWNNDMNGMVYADGLYHLSLHSNPMGLGFAGRYWSHAVSRDLVHWTEMPRIIRSDGGTTAPIHPSMCIGAAFSGGAFVDHNNTLGKQVGDTKTLVASISDMGAGVAGPNVLPGSGSLAGESLAYSTDGGLSYTMLREANPILSHYGRDPKVFWYAPGQHWVMVVYEQRATVAEGQMGIYKSTDLKHWTQTQLESGYHECPEMVELPVDGNPNNKKWVLMDATPKYKIGTFDGTTFTPSTDYTTPTTTRQTIMGDIKAGQCFSNAPDGRAIMMIWTNGVGPTDPLAPFTSGVTLPLELTLKTATDGIRCYANPVPELAALRESTLLDTANVTMTGTNTQSFTSSPLVEVELTLNLQTGAVPPDYIQVIIGGNTITYDVPTRKLNSSLVSYDPDDGKLDLHLYVDADTVETFAEKGAVYSLNERSNAAEGAAMSGITIQAKKNNALTGTPTIESLKVYKLSAINSVNQAPVAAGVSAGGNPGVGTTLNGVYTFVDSLFDAEGASSYRWLRSNDKILDAGDTVVATTRNYMMQAADAESYLFFEVTPVATTGATTGLPTASGPIYNSAPTASSVSAGGDFKIAQALSGNYTYFDVHDVEGTSTYRWIRSADATLDAGDTVVATTRNYTVQAADIGEYLFFEVTPVAATGNVVLGLTGMPVASPAVFNRKPTATGVSLSGIAKQGQTLTSFYTYTDLDKDLEGATSFRWVRSADTTLDAGDTVVATTRNYTVQLADIGDYLFFEVSPVAASGVLTGTPVSTSATALATYGNYTGYQASINWAGSNSSLTADADGDGFNNLQEYAFGSNPVSASSSYIPSGTAYTANSSQVLISHTFNGTGALAGTSLTTNNIGASTWFSNAAVSANGTLSMVSATAGTAGSAYIDLGANSIVNPGGGVFDLEIVLDKTSSTNELFTGGFWSAGNTALSHDSQGSPWWLCYGNNNTFKASTGKGTTADIFSGAVATAGYETFTLRMNLSNTALTSGTASFYKGNAITGTRLGAGSTPFSGDEGFRYVGIGARTFLANQTASANFQSLTLRQIMLPTPYGAGKTTQDYFEITYRENINAADLTYTVEQSVNGTDWSTYSPSVENRIVTSVPGTSLQQVRARVPLSSPTTAQYLRVLVTVSPSGPAVTSAAVTNANNPPTASNVTITGLAKEGQTLTGSYTYFDADGDAQGTSTFRWLCSTDTTLDAGDSVVATTQTYTPLPADVGKVLFFEVTPKAATGVTTGTAVANSATAAITATTYAGYQASTNWAGADSSAIGDADYDGGKNLLEYAFGTNPTSSSDFFLPTARTYTTGAQSYFEITYRENPDAADLTFTVQQSSDLISWSTLTPTAEDIIKTPVPNSSLLQVAVRCPVTNNLQFLRVVVTKN